MSDNHHRELDIEKALEAIDSLQEELENKSLNFEKRVATAHTLLKEIQALTIHLKKQERTTIHQLKGDLSLKPFEHAQI